MRWSLAVLCAALLSGCSGSPSGQGEEPPADMPPAESADAALPTWAVRDWWTFATTLGEATYVVTADEGTAWFMDTADPATAFRDARTDVSRLGPIRKADLGGSQHGDFVKYFDFPLRDNASWQTRWDGVPVTITATQRDDGTFGFVARNATHDMYRYTYDAESGWFREFHFLALDGAPSFTMELSASGHAYSGNVVRWQLDEVFRGDGSMFQAADQFTVPAGATDLYLAYTLGCTGGNGGYAVALQPVNPPGAGYTKNGQCTAERFAEPVVTAPSAGTWAFAVDLGGQGGTSSIEILLRTLQQLPVG